VYGLVFFVLLQFVDPFITKEIKRPYNFFYTFIEFGFFSSFFWIAIQGKFYRKIILLIFCAFSLFQTIYLTFTDKEFDSVSIGIETILVFTFIFLFFYEYFVNVYSEYIYNHYCFWLAIGTMIYLSGSFFIYLLANHISEEQIHNFWYMSYIAESVKNILFTAGIFVYTRQRAKQKIPNQNMPYLDFN
jgi:asparagine N-glycosylation enzyme membrane subunit Stt3